MITIGSWPLPLWLGGAVLAALLLSVVVVLRRRHGPIGVVVYSDAGGTGRPLRSPLRPLSGKPDYVLRTRRGALIPVEYKSYACGTHPPHADMVQIGTYLVLIEDLHGRTPPYGLLRYTDRTLKIPNSLSLRKEVLRILKTLQEGVTTPPEPTPAPALCARCPFAPICDAAVPARRS